MKAKIYLDFNSTHPPDRGALAEAREFYFEHYGNSSGLSLESQRVNQRIEQARENIASQFGIAAAQVIFTSSATESNNLLLRELHRRKRGAEFRVLVSPFEHPSVAEPLRLLSNSVITTLPALRDGSLDSANMTDLTRTDLAITMAVQNESGVIMPLADLVPRFAAASIPVVVDASQLLPKLAADAPDCLAPTFVKFLTDNGCYVTATGHKVGAGFGAGLIFTPKAKSLSQGDPLLAGGNQEHGFRAGSHNTEAIVALSLALARKIKLNNFSVWKERSQKFESLLSNALAHIEGFAIIGAGTERAPGTTLLLLPGIPIDFLVMALDKEGITVSTGTSCKSRSRSPSAALLAMGFSELQALSVIRLSYDQNLTDADLQRATEALKAACDSLA